MTRGSQIICSAPQQQLQQNLPITFVQDDAALGQPPDFATEDKCIQLRKIILNYVSLI